MIFSIVALLLLIWAELAVGIIGTPFEGSWSAKTYLRNDRRWQSSLDTEKFRSVYEFSCEMLEGNEITEENKKRVKYDQLTTVLFISFLVSAKI